MVYEDGQGPAENDSGWRRLFNSRRGSNIVILGTLYAPLLGSPSLESHTMQDYWPCIVLDDFTQPS